MIRCVGRRLFSLTLHRSKICDPDKAILAGKCEGPIGALRLRDSEYPVITNVVHAPPPSSPITNSLECGKRP
jgi:hypothetical protein